MFQSFNVSKIPEIFNLKPENVSTFQCFNVSKNPETLKL